MSKEDVQYYTDERFHNIDFAIDSENVLHIVIRLDADPLRVTEKGNDVIATTKGNYKLPDGTMLGVNAYRPHVELKPAAKKVVKRRK